MDKLEEIKRLEQEKDAVILAHYYVDGEVQKAADYIGDSFYLSKKASELSAGNNMTPQVMKEAVLLIGGRAETECSGNVTRENIGSLVDLGVDYISSGALTHSAPILDISLKNLHAI